MNADGTKIKKILRAGSKIGARAIEKQIINLPQPYLNSGKIIVAVSSASMSNKFLLFRLLAVSPIWSSG